MIKMFVTLILFSCTKTPHLELSVKTKEKINVNFSDSFEKLNKINIITDIKDIDPTQKIIYQYLKDYQEEIQNYRKLLNIIKKYQLSNNLSN